MRRTRRRSPAGLPQVPTPVPPPRIVATPSEPAIVRLTAGRGVLDPIWGARPDSLALVWPDPRMPAGWARVVWPVEPAARRFIAPVDLHVGHVLEVGLWRDSAWQPVYGWIVDADDQRFVVAPSVSAAEAACMAGRAFDVWRVAELARVEDAWRERFEHARRLRNRSA